jgi:hypothetical protein
MSNYDPNQSAPRPGGPEQVFCPYCRGGNAPNAEVCRWCGRPMTPGATMPMQQPQQPPAGYAPTVRMPQDQPPPGYQQTTQFSQQPPAQVNVQQARRPIWPWLVGGLVALCLCGAGASTLLFRNVFEAVRNNPDVFSTPEVGIVFNTPEPTNTTQAFEAEPTPTSIFIEEPAAEDLPTPTSEVSLGDLGTDMQYFGDWIDWMQRYTNAFTEFGQLNQNPDMTSSSWKSDVETQLGVINDVSQEILDYDPSAQYGSVHGKLQEAATHYQKMVDLYQQGIDNTDPSMLMEAVDELSSGVAKMEEATTELGQTKP